MTRADAVRESFIVMDLHHLLLAGLPAHSELPQKADSQCSSACLKGAKGPFTAANGRQAATLTSRRSRAEIMDASMHAIICRP
jgi:hypothetical protein